MILYMFGQKLERERYIAEVKARKEAEEKLRAEEEAALAVRFLSNYLCLID